MPKIKTTPSAYHHDFLSGGGEMGELMRSKNWAETGVGAISEWPQSLKTTLSIVLNSKFPMFLFWGEELTCFYNDAFRPSLGIEGKHPAALGQKGAEVWAEIWPTLKPWIDQVLDGEAVKMEDMLVGFYRNGKMEDIYWTFTYNPVKDETGKVAGVFVICQETTQSVLSYEREKDRKKELHSLFMQAPAAIAIVNGPELKYTLANPLYQETFGRSQGELLGKNMKDVWPEIVDQEIYTRLKKAYKTGEPYVVNALPFTIKNDGLNKTGYINFVAQPIKNDDGKVISLMIHAADVSEAMEARKEIEENDIRLRNLLEQSPVAMSLMRGPSYIIQVANKKSLEILGRSATEVIDLPALTALPELAEQGFSKILNEVYTTGKPFVANEFPVTLVKQGKKELMYINFIYEPLRDNNGNIEGIVSIGIDVSEQVLARKKIEENEERFRTMADNIPNLAWMANADGWIYWYNKKWHDYTGTTPEEMEGWGWQSVHDPEVLPEVLTKWEASIAQGKLFDMVFPIKGADGIFRPFLTRVVPVKDDQGNVKKWFGTNTDITERENLAKQKDDFIGIASHELKTPLTSVKGYIQLIQELVQENSFESIGDLIKYSENSINKLSGLIDDLLDVSKIQAGKIKYVFSEFSVDELLKESIKEARHLSPRHEIIVQGDLSAKIYGDKLRLEQVVNNFLSNAVKYSPQAKEIVLSVSTQAGNLRIAVTDYGIGISEKDLPNLFQRFFRVDQSYHQFQGLGLGLYISAEIVKRHNGQINVESAVGKGSTFSFTIPMRVTPLGE